MAEDKNWIQGAIKRPGAFTKKAEEAGKTTGILLMFPRILKSTTSAPLAKHASLKHFLNFVNAKKTKQKAN